MFNQVNNLKYELRKNFLLEKVLYSTASGISSQKYCAHELIVSLTTYGRRLQDVCFTIESIMQQSLLPNRIILNIDPQSKLDPFPIALQKQQQRGLEVVVEDGDIRSYKKLIPTLKSNPEAIIITIDDDVLYDFDIVERLFNSYLKHPHKVNALRTHAITFDSQNRPLKYNHWKWNCGTADNEFHLFATGVGGVLYPPHCLSEEVFNQKIFRSICPMADDVWFHAMAVKHGTGIVKVPSRSHCGEDYVLNEDVQDMGLWQINTGGMAQNDVQIKAVYEKYGIYDLLKDGINKV